MVETFIGGGGGEGNFLLLLLFFFFFGGGGGVWGDANPNFCRNLYNL